MKKLLPLFILLTACQSSNTGAKQIVPFSIYVEGDSTMFGSRINGQSESPNNPPALLQDEIDQEFPKAGITVENHAEPGSDSFDSLDGTDEYDGTFSTRMQNSSAKIVLTNVALNDPGRGRSSPDQYRSNLIEWISIARQNGKVPVLEEPNPWTCESAEDLFQYVQVQRQVASDQGVLLIKQYDAILEAFPDLSTALQDCEHPVDALYDFKANREYQQLLPLIQSFE